MFPILSPFYEKNMFRETVCLYPPNEERSGIIMAGTRSRSGTKNNTLHGKLRQKRKNGQFYYRLIVSKGVRKEFALKTSDSDEAFQRAADLDSIWLSSTREVALAQMNAIRSFSKLAQRLSFEEAWKKYETHPDRAMPQTFGERKGYYNTFFEFVRLASGKDSRGKIRRVPVTYIDEVTPELCQEFSEYLKTTGLSVDTHNRKIKRLRKIFNCLKDYYDGENPFCSKALMRSIREETGMIVYRQAFTYMANKVFSRGIEPLGAEASFAFVGNTSHTVPQMLKLSHLFEDIPDAYLDSAFLDRIYNYIPGWEVDIIRGEMFSQGYGFIVDYLSEVLHALREFDYSDRYTKYFTLSSTISTRDRDGVNKTFSGLLKILFPDGEATEDQIKELLEYAIEGRKRIKDQLMRIDKTYNPVDFSFTDNASGTKHSVRTLEQIQYPKFYGAQGIDQPNLQQNEEQHEGRNLLASSQTNTKQESGSAGANSEIPLASPLVVSKMELACQPKTSEHYLEVVENQRGIDFDGLFGEYVRGATSILIVDPFIRLFHQARNLMEFIETVLRFNDAGDEFSIKLQTCNDETRPELQESYFEQIQKTCQSEGIYFTWEYLPQKSMHDRYIETDTGWRIVLGRGLDIYQSCDLKSAFSFTAWMPSMRSCKPFTVSYMRSKQ